MTALSSLRPGERPVDPVSPVDRADPVALGDPGRAERGPGQGPVARPGPVARVLQAGVRAYQLLARGRPSPCRYDPSCSTYAHEALAVHGALRGSWFTVRRLGRCHPWGGTGWDPVPPRKAN